jgi:hypothetical protein
MRPEEIKQVRDHLAQHPRFEPAIRMLEFLEAVDGPVAIDELSQVSGGAWKRRYHYIQLVKRYLERIEGKKLINQRNVGYWISARESDKIDEGIKESYRISAHSARLRATMQLIDRDQIKTIRDMNAYGYLVAMNAMAQTIEQMRPALEALNRERLEGHLDACVQDVAIEANGDGTVVMPEPSERPRG